MEGPRGQGRYHHCLRTRKVVVLSVLRLVLVNAHHVHLRYLVGNVSLNAKSSFVVKLIHNPEVVGKML